MRNVTFLASAIVLMAGLTAHAAEITSEQASAAVQAWVDEGSALGRRFGAVTTSRTLSTSSGARLHVVMFAEGGFAVTPADDRIDPVIAFLPSGDELVQDGANPLWVLLSGDIEARARAAGMASESSGSGRAVQNQREHHRHVNRHSLHLLLPLSTEQYNTSVLEQLGTGPHATLKGHLTFGAKVACLSVGPVQKVFPMKTIILPELIWQSLTWEYRCARCQTQSVLFPSFRL